MWQALVALSSADAAEVAARFTRGAYDDEAKLRRFGREIDVATYEFENIAAGPLSALAGDIETINGGRDRAQLQLGTDAQPVVGGHGVVPQVDAAAGRPERSLTQEPDNAH